MSNKDQGEPAAISARGNKPVAILVMHGVAAKTAGQSLEQVTDMLTSYRTPEKGNYVRGLTTAFVYPIADHAAKGGDEENLARDLVTDSSIEEASLDRVEMRSMLESYVQRPSDKHFKTECNQIRRRHPSAPRGEGREIHIFECFWADLSRGGSYGYFRKFVEFYQLVLDLCGLGRKSLDYASRSYSRSWLWSIMRVMQEACEFIITGTIPAVNILLIVVLLFAPIICQGQDFQRWFFPVGIGFAAVLIIAGVMGPFSKLPPQKIRRRFWSYYAMIVGVGLSVIIFWAFNAPPFDVSRTMRLATGVGTCAILYGLWHWAAELGKMRWRMAMNLRLALPGVFFVIFWALGRDVNASECVGKEALLELAQILMAVCQLGWFSFFGIGALLIMVSFFPMFSRELKGPKGDHDRADIRALQTLQISTALAGLLILLVTLSAWQVAPYLILYVVKLAGPTEPTKPSFENPIVNSFDFLKRINNHAVDFEHHIMTWIQPIAGAMDSELKGVKKWICGGENGAEFAKQLFPFSCGGKLDNPPTVYHGVRVLLEECNYNQIYIVILSLITVLVVTCVAFWRVIRIEANPPSKISATPQEESGPKNLGGALNEAFFTLGRIGVFVTWGIAFAIPVSFIFTWHPSGNLPAPAFAAGPLQSGLSKPPVYPIVPPDGEMSTVPMSTSPVTAGELRFPGFLIICGVVLLIAVAKVFGPVLAVTLDVINWLRLYPKENTPRARIVSRLLSVLEVISLANRTRNYDQLIIVAHSQGTVIAVETLRAIHQSTKIKKKLQGLPDIRLFTMGCPLRQLYACRFPHLFEWVHDPGPDPKSKRIEEMAVADPSRSNPNPNPNELFKVKQWINAYGSMDYVGRALWFRQSPQGDKGLSTDRQCYWYATEGEGKPEYRAIEFCIGEAAHTHYLDYGSEIATFLDEIIDKGTFGPSHGA